jgi:hypothetical protein
MACLGVVAKVEGLNRDFQPLSVFRIPLPFLGQASALTRIGSNASATFRASLSWSESTSTRSERGDA